MPTTTARILQSTGLNANKSSIAARELGITSDTEQPVIGSTVGGAKYLGTEELISVVTAAPAAIPILRRSAVSIWCDTTSAGASIALDIRAGAQVAGYRVLVFTVGTDARQTVVQYATGVLDYVPNGCSQEFIWNGSAWMKVHQSYADKYLMGDMLQLPDKPTISAKMPIVDRSINNDLSATAYPVYVPYLRAVKSFAGATSDFAVTVSGSNVTFPNTPEGIAMVQAIINEASVAHYLNNGEIANYTGGTDYSTAATQQSINVNGVDYVITGATLATRIVTVTGTPTAGAQTAIVYPHRIAGSTTTARLPKIGGFIPAPAGDTVWLELINGKRKMDRVQGHWHQGYNAGLIAGAGVAINVMSSNSNNTPAVDNTSVRQPISDTVNGTPRTGKTTAPLEIARNFYDWAGVYVA